LIKPKQLVKIEEQFPLMGPPLIVGHWASCYNPRRNMTILIETSDLSKAFGDFQAVDGVTLQVEAGEVIALLGPNGAKQPQSGCLPRSSNHREAGHPLLGSM
jgi:ABC-type molybdenum transport system ATPase subunit/photorepair protein PhrA